MSNIKNIIFDLGGVLLNIDYNKTIFAFTELGIGNFDKMFTQFHADELFIKMETGKISDEDFRETLKKATGGKVSDDQLDAAWNAMILTFRTESLTALEELSKKYSLFLLSNTNSIHLKYFQQVFIRDTGKPLLDGYFSKCWYSHLVGLRKPNDEIYEFALRDGDIAAGETIFIDDTIGNIEAAKQLGIKTHLLLPHERIEKLGL